MYRLEVPDVAKFTNFCGAVDTEWVTVILASAASIFIEDSNETFAVLQFKSNRSDAETDRIFRIQKDLLKVIMLDGFLEVEVGQDRVHLEMHGEGDEVRTLDAERHQAFTTAFREKFDVIKDASSDHFNAAPLKPLVATARVLRGFVEVEDSVACVMSRDCTMVFREVMGIPDLCLSAQAATSLFNCNHDWYQCKNYVYTFDGTFGLLVSQSRGNGLDDYKLLKTEETGAAVKVHVDFSNLMKLITKVPCDNVVYDFRKGTCKIDKGNTVYGTGVEQAELRVSEKYTKNEAVISARIFTNIIAKLRVYDWDFKVKKHFCEFNADDYTIICK